MCPKSCGSAEFMQLPLVLPSQIRSWEFSQLARTPFACANSVLIRLSLPDSQNVFCPLQYLSHFSYLSLCSLWLSIESNFFPLAQRLLTPPFAHLSSHGSSSPHSPITGTNFTNSATDSRPRPHKPLVSAAGSPPPQPPVLRVPYMRH